MEKDIKRYLKAIGVICILLLLGMKMPHHELSFLQIVIPPIKIGDNVTIYISGLIILPFYIWAINEVYASQYFNMGSLATFLLFIFIGIPILSWLIGFVKLPYYLVHDNVKSLDYKKSEFVTSFHEGEWGSQHQLGLKNYHFKERTFNVAIEYEVPDGTVDNIIRLDYEHDITVGPFQNIFTGKEFDDIQVKAPSNTQSASYFSVKHTLILYDDEATVRILLNTGMTD